MVLSTAVESRSGAMDPNRISLRTSVDQREPIVLPWCKGSVFFGNGFNSDLALNNEFPWMGQTAFAELHRASFLVDTKCQAATFRECSSSASKASTEHMSGSLGVTIGCDYLNANVTGSFDESTSKNEEASLDRCLVRITQKANIGKRLPGLLDMCHIRRGS